MAVAAAAGAGAGGEGGEGGGDSEATLGWGEGRGQGGQRQVAGAVSRDYCAVLNTDQRTLAAKQRDFYPVCSVYLPVSINQFSLLKEKTNPIFT